MDKRQLLRASEKDLKRLAKYLHLHTEGMGQKQIAKLIYWRLTRRE